MFEIKPIHTQAEYQQALQALDEVFDATPGTPEGDRLELLMLIVGAYEDQHYPMEAPDPIEAIKFAMEQRGITPKDLEPAIGRRNRVYEVLNRKRALTLPMIRALHRLFHIPAECLIQGN